MIRSTFCISWLAAAAIAVLRIGIGVHYGEAVLGAIGTGERRRLTAIGDAVNVASRVESATKHLGIPALITASTRALIGDRLATRRLCKVRLPGIDNPVELYELNAVEAWSQHAVGS